MKRYLLLIVLCTMVLFSCSEGDGEKSDEDKEERLQSTEITYHNGDKDTIVCRDLTFYQNDGGISAYDALGNKIELGFVRRTKVLRVYEAATKKPKFQLKNQSN